MICFYDALSLLKRLPNLKEISDKDRSIDILQGYKKKK